MTTRRLPRLAVLLTGVLGTALAAGSLAAGAVATGETAAATAAIDAAAPTPTGWSVNRIDGGQGLARESGKIDADGPDVAVAATGWIGDDFRSYMRFSSDGGKTFGPVVTDADGRRVAALVVDGGTTKLVRTAASGFVFEEWDVAGSRRIARNPLPPSLAGGEIVVAVSGATVLVASATSGGKVAITRSDDGGATWSDAINLTAGAYLDLALHGRTAVLSYGAWSAESKGVRVLTSTDAGTTWGTPQELAGGSTLTDLDVVDDGFVLAHATAGEVVVRRSADGAVWSEPASTHVRLPRGGIGAEISADGTRLFVTSDGSQIATSEDGEVWTPVEVPDAMRTVATMRYTLDGLTATVAGPAILTEGVVVRAYPDTHAPAVRFTAVPRPIVTAPNQTVRFAGSDPDATGAWLRYECAFGANDFRPCTSPHSLAEWQPNLAGNPQELRARAIDAAGRVSPTITTRWTLDRAAPDRPYALGGTSFTLAAAHTFRWSAFDSESGVAAFDVRYSVTPQTAARMSQSWRTSRALTRTGARSLRLSVPRGRTVCVQARAYDRAGRVSAWDRVGCISRPFSDRALRRAGTTKKVRDRRHDGGVATRLSGNGRLNLRGVEAGSIVYVVYKRTPRMGAGLLRPRGEVSFVFGERGSTRYRQVWRSDGTVTRAGSVRVMASAPGAIVIDGLAVLPRWAW